MYQNFTKMINNKNEIDIKKPVFIKSVNNYYFTKQFILI